MHRLVPDFIQEQYAKEKLAGSFEACALFVDISGFTPITDAIMDHGQHGAEVLANIIQEVFDPLVQSVFEQGGFVTNLAGDAFTAVFEADVRSPNEFARSLAAAWQMQQVLTTAALHRTPYGNFAVSVKVGLAAGAVAWGVVSSSDENRAAYYFQGPAIDGCSDAQKLAKSGEVVVDATVYGSVGSMVEVEAVEDHFRITSINARLPSPRAINLESIEPDILARFFPPEAFRDSLRGEFRQVANLFVSLPTVRTEDQLRMFMQIIFELQDRFGGLLNRVDFGDKGASLLLFWGAPLAHENDVTRALNFVLDLQSKTVIPVNAGITYGIAHCGYSGGKLAGEFTCHGRGTTLAARFMQASPRGEIWVDERVAARAEHGFEVEFEGTMAFKGFADKQRVFVLLERKEEIKPFYKSQMVGRQAELEGLFDFVQPIWLGQYPGVMVIWGDPGIGKSRLTHAFLSNLESEIDHEISVFVCQSDEILRESLNPFRYWLRRYFAQSEQQSDSRNKRSFNRRLDRLISTVQDETLKAELDRTRSFLGALVNLDWPDSLFEQLDAQGRYENTFSGLLALLQAESLERPVILLLEDVHWLDRDSKTFLHQLTRGLAQVKTYPTAILATARLQGDRSVLGDDIAFMEINLDQMSSTDQATLASEHLGSPIGSDLLKLLIVRAEGNPFFAEQILRYLQEQDRLHFVEGVWELKGIQETALPTDVRAVLVARLDRLTQNVKEVVQTAAVLGREFEIRLLSRMLHDDPAIQAKVAQAEEMSIWSAINELRYLFKHTLLRDAAYSMQIRSRRQSLHKLATDAIESLYEDDLSLHFGELAYHAEQASLIEKALRYLEVAGDAAKDTYQNSMALDYYGRALSLTPEEEPEDRFRLLCSRELLYSRLGARRDQLMDLNEMSQLAERLDDVSRQAEVLIRRAWIFWWMADYPESLAVSQQAAILAEAAGHHGLTARANYAASWVRKQLGEYADARLLTEKALVEARNSGDRQMEASALSSLGLINRAEGDYFAALKHSEEALAINRTIGSWSGESTTLGNLGVALMTIGDFDAAKSSFEQALVISREIGSSGNTASDLINLSWNAQTQSEWESAIKYGEEGIAIVRGVNQPEMESEGLIWLGHAWLGLGQLEKALAAYQESLTLRRELGQEYMAMGVLAGMARAAAAQDDVDSASNLVTEIVSYLDAGGSLSGTWEPFRIYLTCYQVLDWQRDSRAIEILEIAYQELQRRAAKIPDMEMRRKYLENVPWHREIATVHAKST
jgi:class 3 adenylate cyclase/tetratricopeptide (TPR) repeat protein